MWLLLLHIPILLHFLLLPNCIAFEKMTIKKGSNKKSKEKTKSGRKASQETISKQDTRTLSMESPKMNPRKATKNKKRRAKRAQPGTPTKTTPTLSINTSSESPRMDSGMKKKATKNAKVIKKQKKSRKEQREKIIRKKCIIKPPIDWKKKYQKENINVHNEYDRLDNDYKQHQKNNCRTNWEKCQYCNDYRDRLKALYEIGDDLNIMWKLEDRLLEFDEIYEKSYASWRKISKKDKPYIRAFKKYDSSELPIEFTPKKVRNREECTQQASDDENNTQESDKSDREEEMTQKDGEERKGRGSSSNEKED